MLEAVTQNDVAGDPGYYAFRQTIYVAVGVVLLVGAAVVDPNAYRRIRWPLYGVAIVLLLAVFVLAEEVRGSKRWIQIGFFNFQPSELGKIVLVDRARRRSSPTAGTGWRSGGRRSASIGLAVPLMALVFKEPDFGTTLIYAAIVIGALFFGGTPWRHLAVLGDRRRRSSAGALLWFLPSAGVEVLEPYQRERLTGFVDPDIDPSGSTYNVNQSITAVGSGGFDGRGEANATQTKFNYLPEHSTDFIFSSLAEQRGFVGAAILLLLYGIIIWRGTKIVAVAEISTRRSWRGRSCSRS